jgi:hypothetical protein
VLQVGFEFPFTSNEVALIDASMVHGVVVDADVKTYRTVVPHEEKRIDGVTTAGHTHTYIQTFQPSAAP